MGRSALEVLFYLGEQVAQPLGPTPHPKVWILMRLE